jgi:O-antigen ligase
MNRTFYRFVVCGLFLVLLGVIAGIASPNISDTDLGVVDTGLHLPVITCITIFYLLVLSRLISEPQRFLAKARPIAVAIPILLLCLISAAWSTDPSLTIRRALMLCLTVLIGLIIGTDFKLPELGRLLAAASLIHIAACVVFFVVAPHYLFSPLEPGSLKGLTTHKNVFGFEQGIALLVFLFFPFRRFIFLRWPLVVLAASTLWLSHSSGSMVATLAALCCWPLLQIVRLRREERLPVGMLAAIAVAAGGAFLAQNLSKIPTVFSKDATLTGRTELWSILLVSIQHRLWLGYGYDSFWQGLQGDSLNVIRAVGWLVPTAHNGYLDLLLSAGIVGVILFLPLLIQGVKFALSYCSEVSTTDRFFPALFLVYWLIYNLNESALLVRSGLAFFLFIAVVASISSHPAEVVVATQESILKESLFNRNTDSIRSWG